MSLSAPTMPSDILKLIDGATDHIGGVPLIVRQPETYLLQWRTEAIRLLNALLFDANHSLQSASYKGLTDQTVERLRQIGAAQKFNRQSLLDLLKPLIEHPKVSAATSGSTQLHGPHSHRLAENFTNFFRDWSWDGGERSQHLRFLESLLPTGDLGRVLMLGAGTARLAYDLVDSHECEALIATEINPLFFAAAHQLFNGHSLELYEVAELANGLKNAARLHELKAPRAQSKVKLLLNDFIEDTLPEKSFDIVITPWFIDVLPLPFKSVLAKINRLLKPGGNWVNLGPLMFRTNERAELFTKDEVLALASKSGFECKGAEQMLMTQLKSELSATYRTDVVYGWSAQKTAEAEEPKIPQATMPEFLLKTSRAVNFGFDLGEVVQTYQLMAAVLDGCDKKKSIDQITDELVPDFGLPRAAILPLVMTLVRDFYQQQKGNPMLYKPS